ncbi:MAG: beta-propeller fold lactonase family protein [Phycisphaerae bacterium]|jgi:YVTN family beta-propeller protein|nr:beta-propeller fold lactonase family protein [Phycisphaerae bacterium]
MKRRVIGNVLSLFAVVAGVFGIWTIASSGSSAREQDKTKGAAYHSPLSLAVSPDGKTLYASDPTSGKLVILDIAKKTKLGEIALKGVPRGLAISADGGRVYVAQRGAGTVAVIDTAKRGVTSRITVGKWPEAVALAEKAKRLYVCNQDTHSVSVVDLAQGKAIKDIPVVREPASAVVTPDEKYVVVTNLLPRGVSTDTSLAAVVSIIDSAKLEVSSTVKLPAGSTAVYGACISPDGKWAYVVHQLGRFTMPVTQLELGWVNTYALSIIDIGKGSRLATVLLDDLEMGSANPYDVVCSKDGRQLWISHAGVHEISNVNISLVHELLDGKIPKALAKIRDGSLPDPTPEKGYRGLPAIPDDVLKARSEANIWVRIKADPKKVNELQNDLTALYLAGAIRRFPTGGNSPRGIVLSPDGKQLLIANYYSGSIAVMDAVTGKLQGAISLGAQPKPDVVRRGEILFHDAAHCFQRWNSCTSCHPNGRVDGLNWDLMNDGIGNPKNTKSMLLAHKTPPSMATGIRDRAETAVRAGIRHIQFVVLSEEDATAIDEYLKSLKPVPSPHLVNGKLSEAAARGKVLFDGKAACAKCHPSPLFTDLKMYNVGVLSPNDNKKHKGAYDTPSLIEAYRTAPYLHDGRAMTLKDVLTTHNKLDQHGKVKGLKPAEIDDLAEYLRSL